MLFGFRRLDLFQVSLLALCPFWGPWLLQKKTGWAFGRCAGFGLMVSVCFLLFWFQAACLYGRQGFQTPTAVFFRISGADKGVPNRKPS